MARSLSIATLAHTQDLFTKDSTRRPAGIPTTTEVPTPLPLTLGLTQPAAAIQGAAPITTTVTITITIIIILIIIITIIVIIVIIIIIIIITTIIITIIILTTIIIILIITIIIIIIVIITTITITIITTAITTLESTRKPTLLLRPPPPAAVHKMREPGSTLPSAGTSNCSLLCMIHLALARVNPTTTGRKAIMTTRLRERLRKPASLALVQHAKSHLNTQMPASVPHRFSTCRTLGARPLCMSVSRLLSQEHPPTGMVPHILLLPVIIILIHIRSIQLSVRQLQGSTPRIP